MGKTQPPKQFLFCLSFTEKRVAVYELRENDTYVFLETYENIRPQDMNREYAYNLAYKTVYEKYYMDKERLPTNDTEFRFIPL